MPAGPERPECGQCNASGIASAHSWRVSCGSLESLMFCRCSQFPVPLTFGPTHCVSFSSAHRAAERKPSSAASAHVRSHGANLGQPAVAHRDRHVAPQSQEPRPPNRRAVETPLKLRFVHLREPFERGIDQFPARFKLRIRRSRAPCDSTDTHPGRYRSRKPAAPCLPSVPAAIAPLCSIVRYEMQRVASIW